MSAVASPAPSSYPLWVGPAARLATALEACAARAETKFGLDTAETCILSTSGRMTTVGVVRSGGTCKRGGVR